MTTASAFAASLIPQHAIGRGVQELIATNDHDAHTMHFCNPWVRAGCMDEIFLRDDNEGDGQVEKRPTS